MKAVIQRVSNAKVIIDNKLVGAIGNGQMILLGIETADNEQDVDWLVRKVAGLRIFNDDHGVMNRSLTEVGGEALVVSQFTLHASTKKGNRPSYIRAAKPDIAIPMYEYFIEKLQETLGREIAHGEFGADMQVSLINDGPVTIIMDTKNP